jgi:hypothetical protein
MRERNRDLKRHQQSVRVFLDMTAQKTRKIYGDTHYSRMLVDDVANSMVPYRSSEDFGFSIEPASAEVEHVIADALGRDGYGRNLLGGVRDFFREAVQTLLVFGEAPFEIVYYSESETDKIVGFDLSFIAPWTLERGRGGWVQTVPKDYSQHMGTPRAIELPSDSIARLQLPPSIGQYFSRMMTDLDVLGRDLYPGFGIPVPGSKFQTWQRSHAIALAQATRECGWLARNLYSKDISEFYYVRRFLDFERFKLELRTSILSQVNDILQVVGKRIGFSGRIVVHGLPDSVLIEKSFQDLESGKASFSDLKKPYLGA